MAKNFEALESEIETLVREHLAACHIAAAKAVDRAFGSSPGRTKPGRRAGNSAVAKERRTAEELGDLSEQLYEAVRANPGEGMTVLIGKIGGTARALHRPMRQLKRAGRVRSVGQRCQTRYFPMPESA